MLSLSQDEPFPACPTPFNLAAYVLAEGQRCADKDALCIVSHDHVERWTYAQLRSAVLGTATGLKEAGYQPGDRLLLRLGNTPDFPICYLAALAADMVPVPTSSALTEPEVQQIIDSIKPDGVLHDRAVPSVAHPNIITLDQLRAMRRLPPSAPVLGDPERLGYVIFTSGTSGTPRAVAHAHRSIWARRMMFDGWYGMNSSDRVMHAGAFNWTYTLGTGLMDPWTLGATSYIPSAGTTSQELPYLMRKHGITIFAAAPGVYRQMLGRATDMSLPRLRHGLSAGEKLGPSIANAWKNQTGREIYEAFGMSECSTFISQPAGKPIIAGTLGRAQKGRRIALLDKGEIVRRGSEGTIAVHKTDPGLMLGYLGAQEEMAARMSGPWFLTGDQAVMMPDGALQYLGRRDDMMNAGGYRVSPLEVEAALSAIPGIDAVAVVDVAVKNDTRVIAAFYTGPAPLDEATLRDYVRDNLARYKQPRLFIHKAELPLGRNGKLLRRALAEEFERHHEHTRKN